MENLHDKKVLVPYHENEAHLKRHTNPHSLTIGSKILSGVSEDIEYISALFDAEYAKLIEEEGNPGRKIFAIDCKRKMGTDAVVPLDTLQENSAFTIVREPGTRGEAKINVALIDEKDMPKTSIIHAVYGPYGPTEKAGIYTLMFGDPGMPFPKELGPEATKEQKAAEEKNKQYWDNHVFLVTPKELANAIEAMKANGIDTKIAELRLKMFESKPTNPIVKKHQSQMDKSAIHLPEPILPSVRKFREKVKAEKMAEQLKP